jgi:pimeloyl-ACP methyl ester carboxylesterase
MGAGCAERLTSGSARGPGRNSLGLLSRVFPPPAAAALANVVHGAKLESVPQTGHSVYFERPETFNRLVSSFLDAHQNLPPDSPS